MTPQDGRAILGEPDARLVFGRRSRWVYEDLTIIFDGDRVRGVLF